MGRLVRLCRVCVDDRARDRSRKRQGDRSRIVGERLKTALIVGAALRGRPSAESQCGNPGAATEAAPTVDLLQAQPEGGA